MNTASREFEELDALISAVIDGQITDAQHERLSALLRGDAGARRQYVELISMHALLRQTLGGYAIKQAQALSVLSDIAEAERNRPVVVPDMAPGELHKRADRRVKWSAASRTAAALAIISGLAALVMWALSGPGETAPAIVAAMTETREAKWEDARGQPVFFEEGASLTAQTLRLREGIAKVTFRSGTVVMLDARLRPSRFEIKAQAEAVVHAGRVTVSAQGESEKGFAINLPDDRAVVDADTQVGVDVDDDGATRMHVLTGEVELRPMPAQVERPQMARRVRLVRRGEAVTFGGGSPVREVAAQSTGFIEFNRMVRLDDAQSKGSFVKPDGGRPVRAIPATEAALLAHYTFQNSRDDRSRLTDSGPGGHHGVIRGATWTQGRRGDDQALAFSQPNDRVEVNIPGSFESLSLAAWVRVDGLPRKFNSLLLTDGFDPGEIHWQLTAEGKVLFSVKYAGQVGNDYHSPVVEGMGGGKWVHLATVYNAEVGKVSFFVNGLEIDRQRIRATDVLRIGEAQIGNWAGLPGKSDESRAFTGAFGDLRVFSGALTAQGVRRLHDDSRP